MLRASNDHPFDGRTAPVRPTMPRGLMPVLILLGFSVFINYIDRSNLAIAAPMLKDELGLSGLQLGILFSAFFWTYAVLLPLAGWLVDRIDVNWVLAGGFFLWSAATAATGVAHVFTSVLALRLVLGLGESVAYPSYSKIIALNCPEEHRGLANSIVSCGLLLGPGFGLLLGGALMTRFGWRSFFIVFGLTSMLWLIPWVAWMPRSAPRLRREIVDAPSLFEFVQLRSAWATCLGLFAGNAVNYFLLTWMPIYLVADRHFSVVAMSQIAGVGYILGAVASTLSGRVSDHWLRSGATPTRVRKTFVAGGTAMSGLVLALCPFGGPVFSAVMLVLATVFLGVSASNVWAITQRLAGPAAAGRWTGFQNAVGNMAGVVIPALTGFILDRTGRFEWSFAALGSICFTGTAIWIYMLGPVEQVAWGRKRPASAAPR